MNQELNDLAAKAGVTWFDYQVEALTEIQEQELDRSCLYYKTGAGKSITALAAVALRGQDAAVVVAPPSTHPAWEQWGQKLGVAVETMSHAKFRMADTKLSRHVAVIADEMHMFGGHNGKGWKKLDTLAKHLQAPLVMASATPNYNDAERVYCIQHVLDRHSCKGGFLQFLYANCVTEQDPFSQTPKVLGFQRHPDAAAYLADLPGVFYLPDDLVYQINDITYPVMYPWEFEVFGYDRFKHRLVASQMEERHRRVSMALIDPNGYLNDEAFEILEDLSGSATTPLLVYANHATVADALVKSLDSTDCAFDSVTGKTSKKEKERIIQNFREGRLDVLVGTASLATGTDGLDKMCDWLVILDDTDDDSLRRQLIGRIMPRGSDTDASKKQVYRLLPDT